MGMDLDLAVDDPESGFDDEYRSRFAAMMGVARIALEELGLSMPRGRPLTPRFQFRISLGSYRASFALLRSIDDFVEHVRRYHLPPGVPDAAPRAGEAMPDVLRPITFAEHLVFAPGALFVPVDLQTPIRVPFAGGSMAIASSLRACAALQVIDDLSHLDETNAWDYLALFSEERGEASPGARLFLKGFPAHEDMWGTGRLLDATRLSVEHQICLCVS